MSHIQVYLGQFSKKSKRTFFEILRFLYFLTHFLRQKCVREIKVKNSIYSPIKYLSCAIEIIKISWKLNALCPFEDGYVFRFIETLTPPNYAPGGWKKEKIRHYAFLIYVYHWCKSEKNRRWSFPEGVQIHLEWPLFFFEKGLNHDIMILFPKFCAGL